jgi:penicillin-binding protein 2
MIPVKSENIAIINKALWGAVNERGGTGYALKGKNMDVCGKTGTAQVVGLPQDPVKRKMKTLTAETKDHALFVCFAPYAKPEIVVAVVIENAGHGGSAAAPVAKKIMDVYFAQKENADAQKPKSNTEEI